MVNIACPIGKKKNLNFLPGPVIDALLDRDVTALMTSCLTPARRGKLKVK